jgi:hypothetical protein
LPENNPAHRIIIPVPLSGRKQWRWFDDRQSDSFNMKPTPCLADRRNRINSRLQTLKNLLTKPAYCQRKPK